MIDQQRMDVVLRVEQLVLSAQVVMGDQAYQEVMGDQAYQDMELNHRNEVKGVCCAAAAADEEEEVEYEWVSMELHLIVIPS